MATRAVSKTFGAVSAVRTVSMDVRTGRSHALVGRNGAGKSTLVGMLTGLMRPDEGDVLFDGEPAPPVDDLKRWKQLVACVPQKPAIVPSLSVAENLFLNRQPKSFAGKISWSRLNDQARALLSEWNVDVPVEMPAGSLMVEQRQLVEIARALSTGARVIVLDEPTAELESREIARLFERVRSLQEHGITFLYISHHLQEIYEICTDVTVMRDGRQVLSAPVSEVSENRLVTAMVGSDMEFKGANRVHRSTDASIDAERPGLRIEDATIAGAFADISLTVNAGEIVGLAGLAGSGKSVLGDALAGLIKFDHGSVRVRDRVAKLRNPASAISSGIGYVPQDRHAMGFVSGLSVAENMTLPVIGRLGPFGYVSKSYRLKLAKEMMSSMEIVAASPDQPIASLSGGNQQKVVIGRAMVSNPQILILQHPTTGVDIASKRAISSILENARARGLGILIISDEYDELINCSRIYVMFRGAITREFGEDHSELELVAAMENV